MKKVVSFITMLICIYASLTADAPTREKHFVIIIPSYNNKEWCSRNLDSIFKQEYKNFRIIYIDDCSSDGTADLVEEFCATHPHEFRFDLIRNKTRQGAMANLYHAIHSCNDEDIVITVDGDDWLAHPHVFSVMNDVYNKPVVMSFGQFVGYPRTEWGICRPYPEHVIQQGTCRRHKWTMGPLRTFYAGLFKKIKKEDLMHNGEFFQACWDVAMMVAMLEMAGTHHAFVPNVMYIYNVASPINDAKVRLEMMQRNYLIIYQQQPYQPLSENEIRALIKQ